MIIGIKPLPKKYFRSQNIHRLFNTIHVVFAIVTFVTFGISVMCFLLFKAVSFTEFSEAGMFYMVVYLHLSFYTISLSKRASIFSFMENLEKFIAMSKYIYDYWHRATANAKLLLSLIFLHLYFDETGSKNPSICVIYARANRMSDMFGNYLWNSMMISAQFFVFPSVFVSYYKFYALQLGDKSFQLIFPAA